VLVTELDPPLSPAFVKIVFLPPDEASRLGQAGKLVAPWAKKVRTPDVDGTGMR
jgi:hypothetical protein